MMKYTREDVINFAQALGDWCKGSRCADCPFFNGDDAFYRCKLGGSKPLDWDDTEINEEEPEKKLVPFDFSLKEDRDALMGKRIRTDACDMVVTTFAYWLAHGWQIQIDSENGFSGEYVLENFVFADGSNKGKPVGKEVEC